MYVGVCVLYFTNIYIEYFATFGDDVGLKVIVYMIFVM